MKFRAHQTDGTIADFCVRPSDLQGFKPGPGAGLQVSRFSRWRTFTGLVKINLAIASTLSAAAGYVIYLGAAGEGLVMPALGILLVAMGSCALNQFQDRHIDARMERTRRRPLPAGELKPSTALGIAAFLIASGLLLLWRNHGATVAMTGMLAVFLYNGIYTYLKRVWAFAVVPGALIGALPPIIGWMAAGGTISDPRILALAFFFFIWQTPHFWLLLFVFGADYEEAGLASITRLLSLNQRMNLTFVWLLTTAAASLLLPIYGVTSSRWADLGLLACALGLVWRALVLRGRDPEINSFRHVFRSLNGYAICLMIILIADALTSAGSGGWQHLHQ